MNHKQTIPHSLFLLSFFLIIFMMPGFGTGQEISPFRVAIIHSYHKGFSWTDGVEAGIRQVLQDKFIANKFPNKSIELFTEYLDTKRHPLERIGYQAVVGLISKYVDFAPDLVIVSDITSAKPQGGRAGRVSPIAYSDDI